jgi:thiosulfate/3-mercaptopyruvate sulfurtransferase
MKRKLLLLVLVGVFAVTISGTAGAAEWANPGLMLSAQELKGNLDLADWVIVDCQELDAYAKGHIPGAISLGKRCKKALRDKTSRMFSNPAKYEKFLGKVGIGNDTHVVFYGEHVGSDTVRDAAIAFWILEVLGHDKVHVLNGGIDAWKNAGYSLTPTPAIRPESTFKVNYTASRYAATAEIVSIATGKLKGVQLIDSRSEKEHAGKDIRALRGGHVPNTTINVSHKKTHDQSKDPATGDMRDNGFLSADRVAPFFKSLDKSKRTIAYCQTGSRSGLTYLELRLLGFEDPANWDDSWRVYASYFDNYPVENEQWFNFNRVRALEKKVKAIEEMLEQQAEGKEKI